MKRVILFVIITCLISWGFAGCCFLLFDIKAGITFQVMGMAYMFFPAIVAFCLQRFYYREHLKKEFKVSFKFNKWFVIAILTPLFISILSIFISLLFSGVHFSWEGEGYFERFAYVLSEDQMYEMKEQILSVPKLIFFLLMVVQALIGGSTINTLFAFGEELGWRGYMLYYLRKYSFFKISVFTGIIWGLWHFPLILQGHNYPQHPVVGVFFMIIFCILFSFISTYLVLKSNSVISAALVHGNLNAIAGLPVVYLTGGNDLTVGVTGVAGFIALLIIIFCLYIYDKYITKENLLGRSVIRKSEFNN